MGPGVRLGIASLCCLFACIGVQAGAAADDPQQLCSVGVSLRSARTGGTGIGVLFCSVAYGILSIKHLDRYSTHNSFARLTLIALIIASPTKLLFLFVKLGPPGLIARQTPATESNFAAVDRRHLFPFLSPLQQSARVAGFLSSRVSRRMAGLRGPRPDAGPDSRFYLALARSGALRRRPFVDCLFRNSHLQVLAPQCLV